MRSTLIMNISVDLGTVILSISSLRYAYLPRYVNPVRQSYIYENESPNIHRHIHKSISIQNIPQESIWCAFKKVYCFNFDSNDSIYIQCRTNILMFISYTLQKVLLVRTLEWRYSLALVLIQCSSNDLPVAQVDLAMWLLLP
jgi:hypothetical protein